MRERQERKPADKLEVRFATSQDIPRIVEMFAYYAENTDYTFYEHAPSVMGYTAYMQRIQRTYPFIVAVRGGKLAGYAYAGPVRPQDAYGWDAETTIYLDHEMTGSGVGSCLYRALIELLDIQGFANLYAVIAGGNEASIKLHGKFGFSELATIPRTGYKQGSWRDIVIYLKELQHPRTPDPVVEIGAVSRDIYERVFEEAVEAWNNGR